MKIKEAYLEIANKMAENLEIALMGYCLLVLVMRGPMSKSMSVGETRAVLGQKWSKCFERDNEENLEDNGDGLAEKPIAVWTSLMAAETNHAGSLNPWKMTACCTEDLTQLG
ncbi:putative protein phosphatase 2C 4 [Platanthera zijinensis]|uniref:Uncharacterized protein n=1 Tax=Platanthera zijinensis TaxID=2320716 RepID=A0AAP0BJ99_9ASPA